jgi:hypothetical protein
MWQIHRLSEAAVKVLLMKGLLLNTWYVLVDVLIAVRLHYRLSEAAVILYIISYITCRLNIPLTSEAVVIVHEFCYIDIC